MNVLEEMNKYECFRSNEQIERRGNNPYDIMRDFQKDVCAYCENNCQDYKLIRRNEETDKLEIDDKIDEMTYQNGKLYDCSEFKEMRLDKEQLIEVVSNDNTNTYNFEIYDKETEKVICRIPYYTRKGNKKTLLSKKDAELLKDEIQALIMRWLMNI